MSNTHDATFYVQIEPEFNNYDGSRVQSVKAVAITQKKPDRPRPGTVTTKLTVRVPDAAFLPLRPETVIVVPEDMIAANHPVEVEAGDPQ